MFIMEMEELVDTEVNYIFIYVHICRIYTHICIIMYLSYRLEKMFIMEMKEFVDTEVPMNIDVIQY